MNTFPDIITELGGPAVVAVAAGVDPGVARQWKARANIPPAYWPDIVELAKARGKRGVSMATLAKLGVDADKRRVA